MTVSEIQLFQILKQKLGEQEAQTLVEFVKAEVKDELDAKTNIFVTKEDLANTKVDLIKWMVALIIGLFISLISSFAAILKIFL